MSAKPYALLITSMLATGTLTGCPMVVAPSSTVNEAPIVAAFDHSPKSGVGKDDFVTFTVVANDPEGEILTYAWTCTQGALSSISGQSAAWRPTKADGSFEPGPAQVVVVVSDGQTVTTATANLLIDAEGNAAMQESQQKAEKL